MPPDRAGLSCLRGLAGDVELVEENPLMIAQLPIVLSQLFCNHVVILVESSLV